MSGALQTFQHAVAQDVSWTWSRCCVRYTEPLSGVISAVAETSHMYPSLAVLDALADFAGLYLRWLVKLPAQRHRPAGARQQYQG